MLYPKVPPPTILEKQTPNVNKANIDIGCNKQHMVIASISQI